MPETLVAELRRRLELPEDYDPSSDQGTLAYEKLMDLDEYIRRHLLKRLLWTVLDVK